MTAFDVDLAGLLRVFGGHLYADPAVFVRELVQNAADAILLRREREPDHAGAIAVLAEPGAVVFEDDGAGLRPDGIAAALGRIGYSTKRDATSPRGTTGQFGIGLLSGFLVAERIAVTTRAHGGDPVRWTGRADGTWTIEPAERAGIGTTVRLELAAEHHGFAREGRLRELLRRYVRYLPIALSLGGERLDERPPWLCPDPIEAGRAYAIAHGADPIAVLALARGILWIAAEPAQAQGGRLTVHQNGFLIEDGVRELLPSWSGFVAGVVDAPELSPTASRETYVRDRAAAGLAAELRERVLGWLAALPARDLAAFDRVMRHHATHLRGACASAPELLAAIGDRIVVETNFGDVDLPTLLAASGGDRALRVVTSSQGFGHVAPIATARGLPLVNATYVHDRPFVEAWAARAGVVLQPMDLEALEVLIAPAPEQAQRFAAVLALARTLLEPLDVEPELGRFEPHSLPGFLVTEPTALRERARSVMRSGASPLARDLLRGLAVARGDRGTRFVLNVDNSLVRALPDAPDLELAAHAVRLCYAQAAMQVRRTFSAGEARTFSEDLGKLLMRAVTGAYN
ncbi:MAG TPA: ATP-binding protein [Kofleriaceae bacterium]|nr:ATP-binding protein [Kofleriaceae bacterium]